MGDLAKALHANGNPRGLGETKLRQIERGEITPEARELQAIAEACGVPLAWFTADFSRLDEISPEPRQQIAQMLSEAYQRSEEPTEDTSVDPQLRPAEGQES